MQEVHGITHGVLWKQGYTKVRGCPVVGEAICGNSANNGTATPVKVSAVERE